MTAAPALKARDYWFDNAKALLILSVVVGHFATSSQINRQEWVNDIAKFIYFFHMPVFMIISGRFSQGRVDRKETEKAICQLLLPYGTLQLFMLILNSCLGSTVSAKSIFSPQFGLWYFLTLFIYIIITPYLKKWRFLFPAAFLCAIGVFFLSDPLSYGIQRMVSFYPFFFFGYYTASYSFSFCQKTWFRLLSVLILLGLFVFMQWKGTSIRTDLFTLKEVVWDIKGSGFLLSAEYGIHYVLSFLCFFLIMGISPQKKMFFSYVGTYSVYAYGLHLFLIVYLRAAMDPVSGRLAAGLWLLAGIPLTFLLTSPPVRWLFRFFLEPSSLWKKSEASSISQPTSSSVQVGERDYWFDNAKAILIILVVMGHLSTGPVVQDQDWAHYLAKFIYFFHMPIFMIISGRFSYGRVNRSEYGKACISLFFPFVILQILLLFLRNFLGISVSVSTVFEPQYGLWYFPVLFLYLLVTPLLRKFPFLLTASFLVAAGSFFLSNPFPALLQRAVEFYPFFLFGYYLSGQSFSICAKPWFRWISVLFFAFLFLFFMIGDGRSIPTNLYTFKWVLWDLGKEQEKLAFNYFSHYALSFLSFFMLLGILPRKKVLFSYIGTHSLYVYGLHLLIAYALRYLLSPISSCIVSVIYVLLSIPLSFLLASSPVRRIFRPILEPKTILDIWKNRKNPTTKS